MPAAVARRSPISSQAPRGSVTVINASQLVPLVKVLLGLAILGLAWTILASVTFLIGTGLFSQFPHPFYQWWSYFLLARGNPVVATWLSISASLSSGLLAFFAIALVVARLRRVGPSLRPRLFGGPSSPVRGATDNHGHAAWKDQKAVRALFPGPSPVFGGVVVGEDYRVDQDRVAKIPFDPANKKTWGKGGKAPLLIDPCELGPTHSLIFAGSGAFKSQSAASTLLHWTGSAVILDVAGELGAMTSAARLEMDHIVHHLSLGSPTGFNVLDWIDPQSPELTTNIKSVVQWICGDGQVDPRAEGDDFFRSRGRALVACLLAHMLDAPTLQPEFKTVATLRAGIAISATQMRRVLKGICASSESSYARDLAAPLMEAVEDTFSGIHTTADDMTEWLSNTAAAAIISGKTFKSAQLLDGNTTIFLNLSLKTLQSTPGLARTVFGALLNSAYEANGQVHGRILYLLDEVARLGPMKTIETARDVGRKCGITLQLLYQSVGQMEQQWGREGKRSWYDGVSHRTYAAIADPDTAAELEKTFGTYGVMAASEGSNTGISGKNFESGSRSRGANTSHHEIARPLIRSDELLHDCRTDEAFIVMRGARIRCGRAISFRRAEMRARLRSSRFQPFAE
jgi:type IV secretion system protein VirD4